MIGETVEHLLYLESSAVLAWLFAEQTAADVEPFLRSGRPLVASDLTLMECRRAIIRAASKKRITPSQAAERRRTLVNASRDWNFLDISTQIRHRAGEPFPIEPIRTFDAVHIASALLLAETSDAVTILSLDDRVRDNARALGLSVAPESNGAR